MMAPSAGTADQQRLEHQQRYIDLATAGRGHRRPISVHFPRTNRRTSSSVAEPQVILTAHKRDKRFESAVSVSALREAVYKMERSGWNVVVGQEHAAPANGGRR